MTVFFLLVGLELEREVYRGELSKLRDAALPALAALGGIVVPAGIYLFFNYGTPTASGAGIPMATDIAFALAVLSLAGRRVPVALKVFLTALAVIDDLGAILVIAVFYTQSLSLLYLGAALGVWGVLLLLNRFRVSALLPYLAGDVDADAPLRRASYDFGRVAGLCHSIYRGLANICFLPLATRASQAGGVLYPAAFCAGEYGFSACFRFWRNLSSAARVGHFGGIGFGETHWRSSFLRHSDCAGLGAVTVGLRLAADDRRVAFGGHWVYDVGVYALLAFANVRVVNEAKEAILLSSGVAAVAGLAVLRVKKG